MRFLKKTRARAKAKIAASATSVWKGCTRVLGKISFGGLGILPYLLLIGIAIIWLILWGCKTLWINFGWYNIIALALIALIVISITSKKSSGSLKKFGASLWKWTWSAALIVLAAWALVFMYQYYFGTHRDSDDTPRAVKLTPYYPLLNVGTTHLETSGSYRFNRTPGRQYYIHTTRGKALLTITFETDHRYQYKGIANSYDFHLTGGEDPNWAGNYLVTTDSPIDVVLQEVKAVP